MTVVDYFKQHNADLNSALPDAHNTLVMKGPNCVSAIKKPAIHVFSFPTIDGGFIHNEKVSDNV